MQVVLLQDFPLLGLKGSVVDVKTGYFRNFLSPEGICRMADKNDLAAFAKREEERKAKRQEMLAKAESMLGTLQGASIDLTVKTTDSGSLYAQVHEMEVAEAINKVFDCVVTDKDVQFDKAIKKTGEHKFTVKLSPKHVATMTLNVTSEA